MFGEDGRLVTGRIVARVAVCAKVLVEMMVVVVGTAGKGGKGSRETARTVVMVRMALARAVGRNVDCRRALPSKRGVARLDVSMAWVEAVGMVGAVRHADH